MILRCKDEFLANP